MLGWSIHAIPWIALLLYFAYQYMYVLMHQHHVHIQCDHARLQEHIRTFRHATNTTTIQPIPTKRTQVAG